MCLAIPAKIVELFPDEQNRALVEVVGVRRHIDTGLLQDEPLRTGDWVLIHVGFAMSKISEEQALDQIQMLTMLGESEAALEEVKGYGLEEREAEASP
ncbi:MAG: HypC/HybG/HupF family hydrogenase formation chaperone [Acidobacteriaceae bacterium]|nr:HypC/HybG/HupF family hydrogenase formation chaperone [Acidobacteriaceae bacterium]MBV9763551.1 HypC/HybG/HupF family hydrogenase formation chaperone [Acidobacteriaceae bacterium]